MDEKGFTVEWYVEAPIEVMMVILSLLENYGTTV